MSDANCARCQGGWGCDCGLFCPFHGCEPVVCRYCCTCGEHGVCICISGRIDWGDDDVDADAEAPAEPEVDP